MNRRQVLQVSSATLAATLAGCTGNDDDNGDSADNEPETSTDNGETSNDRDNDQEPSQINILEESDLPGDDWVESDLGHYGLPEELESLYVWNGNSDLYITSARIEFDDATTAENDLNDYVDEEFDLPHATEQQMEEVAIANGGYARRIEGTDELEGENGAECVFRADSVNGFAFINESDGGVDEAPINVTIDEVVTLADEMY